MDTCRGRNMAYPRQDALENLKRSIGTSPQARVALPSVTSMPLNLDAAFDTAAAAGVTEKGPPRRLSRRNAISPQAIGEISGGVASATRAPTTCARPTLRATPDPSRSELPTPPPALTPGVGKRPRRYGCAPGSRERSSLPLSGKGVVVSPARVASGHRAREQRYELRPRGRSSRRQLVHFATLAA